jgi:hypothetical protein
MILMSSISPALLWARYHAALRDAADAEPGPAAGPGHALGAVEALPCKLLVAKPRRSAPTRTAKEASR